jgi:hypothetical protein
MKNPLEGAEGWLRASFNDGLVGASRFARTLADEMEAATIPRLDGPSALRQLADMLDKSHLQPGDR